MAVLLEERIIDLEGMLAQLIRNMEQDRRNRERSHQRIDDQLAEMGRRFDQRSREIDRQLADTDRRISEYKEDTDRRISEYKEDTDRKISEYKEDTDRKILAWREDNDKAIKDMRRQIGEQVNKMGRLVEDIVAPSIERIVREIVKLPEEAIESAIRVKRFDAEGRQREFDAIAICGPYFLISETKSNLTSEVVNNFVTKVLPNARQYFAEYAEKQIIGIVSSLYVDQSLVRYGERQGLFVLGFGEDVMDVLNKPDFQPRFW